jgi:uncharacterized protein (DUF1015 family)
VPRFEPFAGIRYAPAAGRPDDLIAPPYDVVSPAERAMLADRSPCNAIHLELPTSHEEAASLWQEWRGSGVLVQDTQPTFTIMRMTAGGRSTTGVLGALALEDPGHGILPHEETTAKDKADRLGLLSTVRANLSPIWVLSPVPGLRKLYSPGDTPPAWRAVDDDGAVHEAWVSDDASVNGAIAEAVASSPVLVADGHHRFEVGNAYRSADGAAPGAWGILAYVVELAEDELDVEPIHRLLTGIPADLLDRLARSFEVVPAFEPDGTGLLLVSTDGSWLLRPRPEVDEAAGDGLDSSRVRVALDGIGVDVRYQHDADLCRAAVASGEAEAAVLLRPATVDQIAATVRGGVRMPPKTTFFAPKPRTGIVYRSLD